MSLRDATGSGLVRNTIGLDPPGRYLDHRPRRLAVKATCQGPVRDNRESPASARDCKTRKATPILPFPHQRGGWWGDCAQPSGAVDNGCARFRRGLRGRLRRQLQHRRVLTNAEMGQQHDLAAGKLNSIVVRAWIIQVDLPEPPDPVRDVPRFFLEKTQEKSGLLAPDIAVERDLGAGEKAYGHLRLADCAESVRRRVPKLRRNQLVSNLGRS